ncbi:GtrA family protein [Legionella waltersii]|uniref:GtrA-like protein n=1 Tax=Legionella waltersii TaxID=66969 RepID=A0A0W1AN43_9GAMM|nr:GtrA family protein [Legionella waltersii]KTD82743.1 GtrA-like protein [Legionella waltersii]SNV01042.1 GtrA-like protein [Legionella waltersii]
MRFLRYCIIGVLVNLSGYLLYIGVTEIGLSPEATITFLYPISFLMSYFSHYKISFMYAGNMQTAFIRFAMAHVVGLSVNIFMHVFFTKFYNYPHQIVQLAAIPTVAVVLYLLLNNFVFPREIKA